MHHQAENKNLHFLPRDFFTYFKVLTKMRDFFSLNNISPVFVCKAESVYCAIENGIMYMFQIHHSFLRAKQN